MPTRMSGGIVCGHQTALWRCMSFMCACLERLWMIIAPVTHIAVDDHCSSAPLGPDKSPWSGSGLAEMLMMIHVHVYTGQFAVT